MIFFKDNYLDNVIESLAAISKDCDARVPFFDLIAFFLEENKNILPSSTEAMIIKKFRSFNYKIYKIKKIRGLL